MLIKDYLDQNAPSSDQFYDLIQSYKLEYGLILLRDYKNLLNLYKTMKMSYENYKHLTNYMIQYIWEKLHTGHWQHVHIYDIKLNLIQLKHYNCPSIELFNKLIQLNKPFIINNSINYWPSIKNNHSNYWTLNYWKLNYGYRLVPIEIGQKYTDNNWGQKLMTINNFIDYYFNQSIIDNNNNQLNKNIKKGYLAQYDIFSQIPELENDIYIPDYCYITGGSDESINDNNNNTIETNLWFGPKNTISPLHHDNDRANLLTQINGSKLIILYPSIETKNLYPYNDLLSNTSQIDLDHIDLIKFPKLKNAYGYYGIIKKGEMLYIPPRCWHYVRSLTCSFSVNFWWNLSPSLIPSWT
uniref:JmjC domain-containing protein n=1 Tax=Schistosoma mansoni TaxID=6183 RepID=A0A5K4FDE5_SCHMA